MPPTLFVSKFFLAAAESNLLEIDFDPVSQSEIVLYPSLARRPVVKVWYLDPKRSTLGKSQRSKQESRLPFIWTVR